MPNSKDAETPRRRFIRTVSGRVLFMVSLLSLFSLALSVERVLFLYKYRHSFLEFQLTEIARAFFLGLRFDFLTGALLSLPFLTAFFILFLTGKKGRVFTITGILLLAWYILLLIYGYIDIESYRFNQRHLTFELANSWGNPGSVSHIVLKNYLPNLKFMVPAIFIFALFFIKILKRFSLRASMARHHSGFPSKVLSVLLISVFWVFFLRGGVQLKPLGLKDAFRNGMELGMLSLNGLFTTFSTLTGDNAREELLAPLRIAEDREETLKLIYALLDRREEASPDYPALRHFKYGKKDFRRRNVVIFLMKGWSGKFTGVLDGKVKGRSITPFFDELSKKGLLLTNFFGSGQSSVEGLTSLLASMPLSKGLVSQTGGLLYQTRLEPLCQVLKKRGYRRLFIEGASPGIPELAGKMGIETLMTGADLSGNTIKPGINDEDIFLRAEQEFTDMNGPFFAIVYSFTSSSPYKVPSKAFESFGPEEAYGDFFNSIEYSDHALRKFFEKAKSSYYFKNTLFIILGDGEGPLMTDNVYELHRVPCLFYSPDEGLKLKGKFNKPAGQADIVPSLMDLLRIGDQFTSLGKSIFAEGARRVFINFREGSFIWVKEPYMLISGFDRPQYVYDYREKENSPDTALGKELQAEALQYARLFYGLVAHNRLTPKQ